jgi:hypothetical protein
MLGVASASSEADGVCRACDRSVARPGGVRRPLQETATSSMPPNRLSTVRDVAITDRKDAAVAADFPDTRALETMDAVSGL